MKVGDVLARYKPAERQVRILLDGSLQSEIDDARARLRQAKRTETVDGLKSQVQNIEAEIVDLEAAADETSIIFKLSAIPGREFDRLKLENPPTEQDWERYKGTQEANPYLALQGRIGAPEFSFNDFLPKLIGLSIVEVDGEPVEWGEDDGQELWDSLHDGARADLADAAWEVNGQRSNRPLSATATGTTTNSGSGSTTASQGESPTPLS